MSKSGAHRDRVAQAAGHRSRLRDRFRKAGLAGFHDYEVLELLLTFAIPRRDVKPYARALIKRFGDLRGVFDASLEDLQTVQGIGPSAATIIKFLKEAASLYLKERIRGRTPLDSPAAVIEYCRHSLVGERNELFRVIYLNPRDEILDIETVAEGTVDYTAVYPRKIIEGGLRHNAVGVVFVHNHPGGPAAGFWRRPPVGRSVSSGGEGHGHCRPRSCGDRPRRALQLPRAGMAARMSCR
jgi:DNA repair protein RadC